MSIVINNSRKVSDKSVHSITKIFVKGKVSRYFCDDDNTSYPTLTSVMKDHPNFDQTKFIIFDKRKGLGVTSTSQTTDNSSYYPTTGDNLH